MSRMELTQADLDGLTAPRFEPGTAGFATVTIGSTVQVWVFDGHMGKSFRDRLVGVIRYRSWTLAGKEPHVFIRVGWKNRMLRAIEAAILDTIRDCQEGS